MPTPPSYEQDSRAVIRGKLRIYFGAAAGVGKTHAMLLAARKLRDEGVAVLLGPLHSSAAQDVADLRSATAADGEFDLDAALASLAVSAGGCPGLILIDQLAHTNPATARHPKRWQDVEECLAAGIDVFTTLNVADLESLNDVVGDITGLRVAETVPDTIFDRADEIVLVDVPFDELHSRLQARQSQHGEFADAIAGTASATAILRNGHLIALRELALRRTADRAERQVQAHRTLQSINPVWKTATSLLLCVGPEAGGEHIVRSCARLAKQMNAKWTAIHVETPALQRLSSAHRERILGCLKLAASLGAGTEVVSHRNIARAIANYARSRNFSKIVLGRSRRPWYLPWQPEFFKNIAAFAPDIDLIEIARAGNADSAADAADGAFRPAPAVAQVLDPLRLRRYFLAAAASLATALLATPLLPHLDLANIAMLFILTVLAVTVRFGRGASVVATVVAVAAFDFFFVPPRFSFAIDDLQYIVTFIVMLMSGLITGDLAAGLRYQAQVASHRESRSRALYEFAGALSGTLQTVQIFEITRNFIQNTFDAKATLLLPDDDGRLCIPTPRDGDSAPVCFSAPGMGIAQWAFDHASVAGAGTDTFPANKLYYLPLVAPMRTRGILVIEPRQQPWGLIPEQHKQLETFAALAAIALERVHYIEVAQDVLVKMESERLRNSLLAALSHDLRTPLTSLVGLAESLTLSKPALTSLQLDLANGLRDEAVRMNNLVSNLLEMARIQSGNVKLNLQWQTLEEVVGSALRASQTPLRKHRITTHIGHDLPLVRFDAVLIERVLCNLLENAAKYTPADTQIDLAAEVKGEYLQVTVSDNGPGLPAGREEALFEKFTRGERESAKPGVGLGLSICRAIVEAHHGGIQASKAQAGGACFMFTLPLGEPPNIPLID